MKVNFRKLSSLFSRIYQHTVLLPLIVISLVALGLLSVVLKSSSFGVNHGPSYNLNPVYTLATPIENVPTPLTPTLPTTIPLTAIATRSFSLQKKDNSSQLAQSKITFNESNGQSYMYTVTQEMPLSWTSEVDQSDSMNPIGVTVGEIHIVSLKYSNPFGSTGYDSFDLSDVTDWPKQDTPADIYDRAVTIAEKRNYLNMIINGDTSNCVSADNIDYSNPCFHTGLFSNKISTNDGLLSGFTNISFDTQAFDPGTSAYFNLAGVINGRTFLLGGRFRIVDNRTKEIYNLGDSEQSEGVNVNDPNSGYYKATEQMFTDYAKALPQDTQQKWQEVQDVVKSTKIEIE